MTDLSKMPLSEAPTGATVTLEGNQFKVTDIPTVPIDGPLGLYNKDKVEILEPVIDAICNEGLEYALLYYSSWEDIIDSDFQCLLSKIRDTHKVIESNVEKLDKFIYHWKEYGAFKAVENAPTLVFPTEAVDKLFQYFVEMEIYLKANASGAHLY